MQPYGDPPRANFDAHGPEITRREIAADEITGRDIGADEIAGREIAGRRACGELRRVCAR